jgi:hypothetical protein
MREAADAIRYGVMARPWTKPERHDEVEKRDAYQEMQEDSYCLSDSVLVL